jgi:NADPH:quinone reductase-like Zn-dependent oxidoreductase
MKAVVYREYGSPDTLRCEDVPKPIPGDTEVLLRVKAAALNPLDWHFMRGTPYIGRLALGLRHPKVTCPGKDVAGVVDAVGKSITQLVPGDEVFGTCRGALAEYACAPESSVVAKPKSVTFEQVASLPIAGLTALQGLRDRAQVKTGRRVLINGAAGGVGTFAVQIGKMLGADVTGVCSTRNVEFVRSLGADQVLDYSREDFTKSGRRYDVLFDCVANRSLSACRRVLERDGTYVMVGASVGRWIEPLGRVIRTLLLNPFASQKLILFVAKPSREDLTTVGRLVESGIVRPVIEARYRLDDAVQAMRIIAGGHARGKVVVTV